MKDIRIALDLKDNDTVIQDKIAESAIKRIEENAIEVAFLRNLISNKIFESGDFFDINSITPSQETINRYQLKSKSKLYWAFGIIEKHFEKK